MVSTFTRRSAEISLRALALGAKDYIPKPETTREATTSVAFRRELIEKIRALGRNRFSPRAYARAPAPGIAPTPHGKQAPALRARKSPSLEAESLRLRPFSAVAPRVLLIGSSTGGPQALTALIEKLPAAVDRAPVLIAQHMPPMFTTVLAEHLSRVGGRGAHEAEDGEPVLAGGIYVAPGGRHMRVARDDDGIRIALDDDPPINFCKPAVDALFTSAVPVMGRCHPGARSHRHGRRRHARRHRYRGGRRQRDRPGRGDERGVGYAPLRGAGGLVLGRATTRSDGAENHSPVLGRSRS